MTAPDHATDASAAPCRRGLRVLVVEDQPLAAAMMATLLHLCGAAVVGPAPTLGIGLALARTAAIDLAFLDVELDGGRRSFPIADLLAGRGVPIVFATIAETVDFGIHAHRPLMLKPICLASLRGALLRYA